LPKCGKYRQVSREGKPRIGKNPVMAGATGKQTVALLAKRDRFVDAWMSVGRTPGALRGVSHENSHADDTNAGVFGLVSGNPGIDRVQRQVGGKDLSGTLVYDGVHSSILSIWFNRFCIWDSGVSPFASDPPGRCRNTGAAKKNPTPARHGIENPIVAMGQGGSNVASGRR
jgi:hypothetical protein